jgi:glutathione peroxidase
MKSERRDIVMSVYQFSAKSLQGEDIAFDQYKGKVLLVVNTASKCVFTPQYKELQSLYDLYKEMGFTILGFPCDQFRNQELTTSQDIREFCQVNYGVTFPMFAKIDVNGERAHPLFDYLTKAKKGLFGSKTVKWNFTKFLISVNGEVIDRYAPTTSPLTIQKDIHKLLQH